MFTVNELKPGMLVKLADGRYGLCIPINTGLSIIGESLYGGETSILTAKLRFRSDIYSNSEYDIVEVYDLACSNRTDFFLPSDRKCLWKYGCTKEMTIEEIEKELGYTVKIVKEH